MIALGFSVVALFWRLPWHDGDRSRLLVENDNIYQLYLVTACLQDFPTFQSVDPKLHYPDGYRVHWLAPAIFFYASAASVVGLKANNPSLADFLSTIPPYLGVLAIILTGMVLMAFRINWV